MPTVRLGAETIDKLRSLATAEGMPYGEFVRSLLEGRAHGLIHVESVAVARIRRVVGIDVGIDHDKLQ